MERANIPHDREIESVGFFAIREQVDELCATIDPDIIRAINKLYELEMEAEGE